jgi:nitroreductase
MATIMEIIKKRKSIRAYQDKPLPKDVISDILEAARYAPTAHNRQELEYKVITSKSLMSKLSEGIAAGLRRDGMPLKGPPLQSPPGIKHDFFRGAPLVIIITAPKDNVFAFTDSALAVQNILLYATSIGLGSCFIGMTIFLEKDKNMRDTLHIADNMSIVAAVVCGYPAENPEPKEKKQKAEFFE